MGDSSILAGLQTWSRRPETAMAEIAWRWALRMAAWCLLAFAAGEFLDSMRLSDPHPFAGAAARFLVVLAVLAAGLVLMATAASGAARAALLPSLVSANRVRPRFGPQLAISFLRAVLGLAVLVALVGCWCFALWIANERWPVPLAHPGAFVFVFVLFGLLGWCAWWVAFTTLNMASVAAAQADCSAAEALARSLAPLATGSFAGATFLYGALHAIVLAIVVTICLALLPESSGDSSALAVAAIVTTLLAYVTFADWLATLRFSTYAAILRRLPDVETHTAAL
jgi:hypothetical protein